MLVYDTLSHLPIADEHVDALSFPVPSHDAVLQSLASMILSASGWRKVFAKSGDEEDSTDQINAEDATLTALAALALCRHLGLPAASKEAVLTGEPVLAQRDLTILVGLDARPTGRVLGDIVCRTLTSLGCKVRYLFITAAPQIMADCNLYPEEASAFFYISASHNPVGHNGFKFGSKGGVYPATEAEVLKKHFLSIVQEEDQAFAYLQNLSASMPTQWYQDVLSAVKQQREQSEDRYEAFTLFTATKSKVSTDHDAFVGTLATEGQKSPLGILGELNGSARSVSIDKRFLTKLGIKVVLLNDKVGQIVHAIVPEGESLQLCQQSLESLYARDNSFRIGYVPDNDGDRGNLVYIDTRSGKAQILDAQSVFALVVLAELSHTRLAHPSALLATVVNGPTSLRIDKIAQTFDAEVFRCEVGEANVVELAEKKRDEGYLVPILGEGSNGGNITHPAKVRDPLNTLLSLIKLLRNRDIAKLWFRANGHDVPHPITLEKIIESLPAFQTTGAFSDDGKMQVAISHQILKNRYEVLLQTEWEKRKRALAEMDIHSFAILQTEGTESHEGMGEAYRHEPYTGGYKVVFKDRDGSITDFLWMRGSKTEPVFRVVVDAKGEDPERYHYLLNWHRSMLATAAEA
ncbi:MAG: phosphoglucomutase [Sphaerochaeta sp.]|nr:phosphoglucomutase [Sphaerochaeta sp.]